MDPTPSGSSDARRGRYRPPSRTRLLRHPPALWGGCCRPAPFCSRPIFDFIRPQLRTDDLLHCHRPRSRTCRLPPAPSSCHPWGTRPSAAPSSRGHAPSGHHPTPPPDKPPASPQRCGCTHSGMKIFYVNFNLNQISPIFFLLSVVSKIGTHLCIRVLQNLWGNWNRNFCP